MIGTPGRRGLSLETVSLCKRFGTLQALDSVSMSVAAASVHALLGENGAGKSTLVKCLMGFHRADQGQVLIDGREREITDPRAAQALGLGMVYQHFTLAPSLTGAENLLVSRARVPAVIDWKAERIEIGAFMERTPLQVPLDRPVGELAAGEKQKLEILKQLYLGNRLLVLDEPTSVLTPAEADELLGLMRDMAHAGEITVLIITHKLREVQAFADAVTVLRHGRKVGGGSARSMSRADMASLMVGHAVADSYEATPRRQYAGHDVREPVLALHGVSGMSAAGRRIEIDKLEVAAGEIVGVAGVSGNGQRELFEMLTGQRPSSGTIAVHGRRLRPDRDAWRESRVRFLPEEPLANACAPTMSVADNLALRNFDVDADERPRFWLDRRAIARNAARLIEAFGIRSHSLAQPISALSGGNVQRAVLARELDGAVDLLVVANPCFGLDFAAVQEIHGRLIGVRDEGCAVLLFSEDLDEILALADRVVVMSDGRIGHETPRAQADRATIGNHMAGHH